MVFIEDSAGEFDAPIDKIWKLREVHLKSPEKVHPAMKNHKIEMQNDNVVTYTWDQDMKGMFAKVRVRATSFYPVGLVIEILEGPLAGSKFFNYYIPRGKKTGVALAGEFKSPMLSDEKQLKSAVMEFLDTVYEEDVVYLKKMK